MDNKLETTIHMYFYTAIHAYTKLYTDRTRYVVV